MSFALKATRSNGASRILRCILALTAWQAPLPYVHSHESACHASVDVSLALVEHLHTEHVANPASGHVPEGWHMHWEPLDAGDEPEEWPIPCRQRRLVVDAFASGDDITRLHCSMPWVFWAASDRVQTVSQAVTLPATGRRVHGFFETFAPEMPLPIRLGVLRC